MGRAAALATRPCSYAIPRRQRLACSPRQAPIGQTDQGDDGRGTQGAQQSAAGAEFVGGHAGERRGSTEADHRRDEQQEEGKSAERRHEKALNADPCQRRRPPGFEPRDTRIQQSGVRQGDGYHRLAARLLQRLRQGSEKRAATADALGATIGRQLATGLVAKAQNLKGGQEEERLSQCLTEQGAKRVQVPNVVALMLKRG